MKRASIAIVVFVIAATELMLYLLLVNVVALPTTTTTITGRSGTLSATQMQQNAEGYGIQLNISAFSCGYGGSCKKVLVAGCDNNVPAQSVCINPSYYSEYVQQYDAKYANHTYACPAYIMAGNITCSCNYATNSCVEYDTLP